MQFSKHEISFEAVQSTIFVRGLFIFSDASRLICKIIGELSLSQYQSFETWISQLTSRQTHTCNNHTVNVSLMVDI